MLSTSSAEIISFQLLWDVQLVPTPGRQFERFCWMSHFIIAAFNEAVRSDLEGNGQVGRYLGSEKAPEQNTAPVFGVSSWKDKVDQPQPRT